MRYSLYLVGLVLFSCRKEEAPQFEGKWRQEQYVVTERGAFGNLETTNFPSTPNSFIVVSSQTIEYQSPNFSAPITQPYLRTGNNLRIAQGTPNDRRETIKKLTAQTLVLRIARQRGIMLADSTIIEYSYTRN